MIQIEDWEYEYNAIPTMMKNEKKWLLEQVQKDLWKCDFWKPAFYKVLNPSQDIRYHKIDSICLVVSRLLSLLICICTMFFESFRKNTRLPAGGVLLRALYNWAWE